MNILIGLKNFSFQNLDYKVSFITYEASKDLYRLPHSVDVIGYVKDGSGIDCGARARI